jgi:hypothetical protein
MAYLQQLSLAFAYSQSIFNHYYRKHNGANGNAYLVGLNAADLMIKEFNLQTQNIQYDTTYEN